MNLLRGVCCAARSVHLHYKLDDSVEIFYNEVSVELTTPGSYFMVCGWRHGYFGIQHLTSSDEKIALFSVWDPTNGDDPANVAISDQVLVEDVGKNVQIHRFGGEGTGAKLMAPLQWKVGDTVPCFVTARLEGDRSCYTGWIKHPERGEWWRLGTLKTKARGALLTGLYSFVEDFRRDVKSVHQTRHANFGNGWVKTCHGVWCPLSTATFTASSAEWEAKESIDAGACSKGFYLSTGGKVRASRETGCCIDCQCVPSIPPSLPLQALSQPPEVYCKASKS